MGRNIRPNTDTEDQEGVQTVQTEEPSRSPITRSVGYVKQDGTTDTMDVYVDPDGNIIPYTAGSPLVIPEYERRLQEAHLRADQDAIQDIQEDYQEARDQAVQRLHDRAARRRQEEEEAA